MNTVAKQYQEIQEELDLNQQEYKAKQTSLLKRLSDLQNSCKHINSTFVNDLGVVKCPDCSKIIE